MVTRTGRTSRFTLRGTILIAWTALVATMPFAQDQPNVEGLTAQELKAQIDRLKAEIDALANSPEAPPEWQELRAGEKDLEKLRTDFYKSEKDLRDRMMPKTQLPQVEAWRKRFDELHRRYYSLTNEDVRRTRSAGIELTKERHRQLLALPPADSTQLRRFGFDVMTFPHIDGSTSTQPLATLIASRCFQVRCDWIEKGQQFNREPMGLYYNDAFSIPGPREPEYDLAEFTMKAMADEGPTRRLAPIINGLLAANASTHDAYVNIIEGRSDIGLLARGPSPDELELAFKKGVELETVPIALDAFVFIVNEANPVAGLTTAQIRDVYSGRIANWKDLGGGDRPLMPYQRERNSGSQELMIDLVMKDLPFKAEDNQFGPKKLISYGMGGPFLALTRDENGLAYSVYYYEHYMSGSARTRPIAVDGVEPTYDTIANRTYPYTSEVLAVTRKGLPPDAPAIRLRDWLLSPEGQTLVRKSGYVPVAQ